MICTFQEFFSSMDWNLLEQQRKHLLTARKKTKNFFKRAMMNRILNLLIKWWNHRNKPSTYWKIAIDWKKLKYDKLKLLRFQKLKSLTQDEYDAIEGIINGLDYFQDSAIDELGMSKRSILYLTKES